MFKFQLFGRLNIAIAITTMLFYTILTKFNNIAEDNLSTIEPQYQKQLTQYANEANNLLLTDSAEALSQWQKIISIKEGIWLSVIKLQVEHVVINNVAEKEIFNNNIFIGRDISWPIHLDHEKNPIMDIPLAHKDYHLLIQLPSRMRPGTFWNEIYIFTSTSFPIIFSLLLSCLVFRFLLAPLRQLQSLSKKYAKGDFDQKIYPLLANRHDEISDLAYYFDKMGDRLAASINQQQQLIEDISHELRTPLTRIQLCLNGTDHQHIIERVNIEIIGMRKLVEETLTLAWLDNEKPLLNTDDVDLIALIEAIVDDAHFEFPQHSICISASSEYLIKNSSHLALSQSLENIIRNACKYTPKHQTITISLVRQATDYIITVSDQGPGVPSEYLTEIFKPFFRIEKSRQVSSGGFGLGLAIAKRQINALGGSIAAKNHHSKGLVIHITLPCNREQM